MLELFAVIAVVLVAVALTVLFRRRRRDVWRRFARRHGFRATADRVTGRVGDREFLLSVRRSGSDEGVLGIEEMVFSLELRSSCPRHLFVVRSDPVVGKAHELLEERDVELGDEAFDRKAMVRADDEAAAREYLTPERRKTLLAFFEQADDSAAGIDGGALFLRRRSMVESPSDLDDRLALLRDYAQRLDRSA